MDCAQDARAAQAARASFAGRRIGLRGVPGQHSSQTMFSEFSEICSELEVFSYQICNIKRPNIVRQNFVIPLKFDCSSRFELFVTYKWNSQLSMFEPQKSRKKTKC